MTLIKKYRHCGLAPRPNAHVRYGRAQTPQSNLAKCQYRAFSQATDISNILGPFAIFIILAFLFSACHKSTNGGSQGPSNSKIHLYDSPNSETVAQIAQSNDGGYYIFGSSLENHLGAKSKFLLVKTDANGAVTWRKTYTNATDIKGVAIIQKPDGTLLLCGNTIDANNFDLPWFLTTDIEGNIKDSFTFTTAYSSGLSCVYPVADGFFVGCNSNYNLSIFYSGLRLPACVLAKLDYAGNKIWKREMLGSFAKGTTTYQSHCSNITVSNDGNLVTAGIEAYGTGFYGPNSIFFFNLNRLLFKLTNTGNVTKLNWAKSYGSRFHESATLVRQAADSSYYVIGSSNRYQTSVQNLTVSKYNKNGDTLWTKYTTDIYTDTAVAMSPITSNGFVVLYNNNNNTGNKLKLIKFDLNGNIIWQHSYLDKFYMTAKCLLALKDGSYLIAGNSNSFGKSLNTNRIFTLKVDASGNLE